MYSPRPCVNFLRAVSVAQMELDDCQNLSTSSPSSSSSSSSSSSALIPSRFDSSFDLNLNFIGVENGEVFEVGKKNQMVVEVFECVHSVPCVGLIFGFFWFSLIFFPSFFSHFLILFLLFCFSYHPSRLWVFSKEK